MVMDGGRHSSISSVHAVHKFHSKFLLQLLGKNINLFQVLTSYHIADKE